MDRYVSQSFLEELLGEFFQLTLVVQVGFGNGTIDPDECQTLLVVHLVI